MTVDVGQRAVAAAEAAAFGGTSTDEVIGRELLHARVLAVAEGAWWAVSGPPVRLVVPRASSRASRATMRASTGGVVVIQLTDEQRTLATGAHELAHALAGVAHGHDPLFRAAYVDVVAVLAGGDAGRRLSDAFVAHDVPVGRRAWPAPWIADGPGFRLIP